MRKTILVFILLSIISELMANGGGVAYYGANGAGNPYFKNFPEIEILREDLLIIPIGDRIDVRVTYLMNNTAFLSLDLHYAFPVDFWCQDTTLFKNDIDETVRYIKFSSNNQSLKYKTLPPTKITEGEHSHQMRLWYFTTIHLPQGITQLTVEYSLKSETHKEVMHDGLFKDAKFSYDFSPAETFGNAKVKEFSITIDATHLESNNQKIDIEDDSYAFLQQGSIYTYSQLDFDLKQARRLNFKFDHSNQETDILISRIPNRQINIIASSATNQYPISNLTDLNFESAFVFGKNNGIGEWIEITATDYMTSIYILPGYYKSEETYRNNNRIKKVLVEFLSDQSELMRSEEVEFADQTYQKLNYSNFAINIQHLVGADYKSVGFYNSDILIIRWMPGTVRLTIKEVYKGDKFNDTCISEIIVSL